MSHNNVVSAPKKQAVPIQYRLAGAVLGAAVGVAGWVLIYLIMEITGALGATRVRVPVVLVFAPIAGAWLGWVLGGELLMLLAHKIGRSTELSSAPFNPLNWTREQQTALVLAAAIGASLGVVLGYLVYESGGGGAYGFGYWLSQPIRKAGLWWGIFGASIGTAVIYVQRLSRPTGTP